MLSKLFGSQARAKILKLFLINSDSKFYVRELSRRLDLQINSVRRELDNLEKFGLLASGAGEKTGVEEKKNKKNSGQSGQEKKYYHVNRDFVLYDEIRALIVKAQLLYGKDFEEKARRAGKIKLLVLSGFFTGNQESPIDILAVGQLNKPKFLQAIRSLEKDLDREINYTLMRESEFRYRKEMVDIFIYGVLEGKKIVIVDEIS